MPRFMLVNGSSHKLEYQQQALSDRPMSLATRAAAPFHWPRSDLPLHLVVRFAESSSRKWSWSGGFPIHNVGTFHVKVHREYEGEAQVSFACCVCVCACECVCTCECVCVCVCARASLLNLFFGFPF